MILMEKNKHEVMTDCESVEYQASQYLTSFIVHSRTTDSVKIVPEAPESPTYVKYSEWDETLNTDRDIGERRARNWLECVDEGVNYSGAT